MPRIIKPVLFIVLCIGVLCLTAMTANAAESTATIAVSVMQDDNVTPIEGISSGSVSVKNAAGETLDQALDYTISCNNGVVTIDYLFSAEPYYITVSRGSTRVTSIVTAKLGTTVTAKMRWCSSTVYSAAISGAIVGNVVDNTGTALSGVIVKAYSKDAIYEGTSDTTSGAYKIFAPAGTYTLVVCGKDTSTDYANVNQSIKVIAGQSVGPLVSSNGQTRWSSLSYGSNIGFSNLAISGTSKAVTGTALKGATVSVYLYEEETLFWGGEWYAPIYYQLLGSKKITGRASDATGSFSIKLPVYPANKKISIKVVDTALNEYEDTTYTAGFSKLTATLTADTKATIVTPVNIVETEPTGVARGNFNSNITSIVVTCGDTTETSQTLTTSQYSVVTKGKLIIPRGVLPTAQDYTIRVSATDYNDVTVVQTVKASTTKPPTTISGTFTLKAGGGSAAGSAQFTSIGTADSTDTLVYIVSNKNSIQTKLGNTLTGYTALSANTDIAGLSAASTKYIHVYEINSADAVVKAKVFTLSAATIKT